jgi:hypothetical protein
MESCDGASCPLNAYNPEGETLSRLMELRNALIDKARAQLMAHGRRLQYSGETLNNLESYLYD